MIYVLCTYTHHGTLFNLKKEVLIHATIGMHLEDIPVGDLSQLQKGRNQIPPPCDI